jgi:hypothetical protein
METTEHKQPCACGDCADNRRQSALAAAKELPEARRSAAACSPSFSATPRTDAFCASLKGVGNWECWQKTASFAADLERELATVRRDLRGLMEEYADRRAQWGDEYLWRKHEDTELVEDIRRRLLENHQAEP